MPSCVFIGGALDGELREVDPQRCDGEAWVTIGTDTYHIANGIARHESVSEEEVGRMVHRLLVDRRTNNGHDGLSCTCTIACKTACKGECGCEACRNAYCDAIEE
jgi:hypothetical protein